MAIPVTCTSRNEGKKRKKQKDDLDLEEALWPLLTFGKILGIVPLSIKWLSRWKLIFIVFLFANVVVDLYGICRNSPKWRTPLDVAQAIGSPTFFINGFFIYYYMNRHMNRLKGVIHEWKLCEQLHMQKDRKLFRDVNLWGGLVFASAILENLCYHFKLCSAASTTDPFLTCAYYSFGGAWPQFFKANEFLGIYHLLTNKLALYAWNFMDVLIMMLSRAIYFQFDVIGKTAKSRESWSTLRAEFSQAMRLLKAAEKFLSPMVFASYGMNTYALCMQFNLWLTPTRNKNTLDAVYSVWSSLHLVARVLLVSIHAANINSSAMKLTTWIKLCPNEAYNMDLYRLEETVASAPLGLTGLGCFMVTRNFILTLVSVVFTFEVVLLQSFATTLVNPM